MANSTIVQLEAKHPTDQAEGLLPKTVRQPARGFRGPGGRTPRARSCTPKYIGSDTTPSGYPGGARGGGLLLPPGGVGPRGPLALPPVPVKRPAQGDASRRLGIPGVLSAGLPSGVQPIGFNRPLFIITKARESSKEWGATAVTHGWPPGDPSQACLFLFWQCPPTPGVTRARRALPTVQ